ncbi:MAG: two-component system, NtrC family, nitrogen regulation response regulator NtrX [Thermoanaerobaculia bacterium]|jgi:two-component system nitrogen regulation response regulator NtrX|nr:two-component system, NtrC family, nitrogen regulation response regulator NtrX [Thermoanaerobaculia bacterium]
MAKILIIDDEAAIRETLANILQDEGHSTTLCDSGEAAIAQFARDEYDLVFLDLWLPGIDGMAVLERLKSAGAPPVIVISGHGNIDSAVRATRLGAYDFLEKPLSLERVLLTVNHALADRKLRDQVRDLRQRFTLEELLVGESEPMKKLDDQIRAAAPSNTRVLITGENGSGKEIVARTLHRLSHRAEQPFIDVNCAAIPEELIESELFGHRKGAFTGAIDDRKGKFELADGGTLFLDEIGDMSLKTQAKVLRVLQEQTFQKVGGQQTISVDVRVIAATNKSLETEIANGSFRSDLYYRLNVVPMEVPPLRARGSDIVLLAEHFLRRFAAEAGMPRKRLSAGAGSKLRAYHWPGNVRELRNVMERIAILMKGDLIEAEDVQLGSTSAAPAQIDAHLSLKEARDEFEKQYILSRLREFGGNVSRTAEALGVERSNLYRKLNAYGIRVERG